VAVVRGTTSADVAALFGRTFGGDPQIIASAPGRVNLIGEHTDYNGGEVLPIGISQRTWVALRLAGAGSRSSAVSSTVQGIGEWDARQPVRSGQWWDYVSGVTVVLAKHGVLIRPTEVAVMSDVPPGAGLSSSAAIEVATAVGLSALSAAELTMRDAAILSQRAESEFVGVASGIMDQFASAMAEPAHALHLWCDTAQTEQVPMRETVLVFDTSVPRSLRHSDFNTRRAECEQALVLLRRRNPQLRSLARATPEEVRAARLPAPLDRRALHVSEETRRVQRTVDTLRATGTIDGQILYESHESLRALYECSTPELDWFVQRAKAAPGVRGARLTGAGWGGCAIAVADGEALETFAHVIIDEYRSQFGLTPRSWIMCADSGARIDSLSP
jgi:galactokinase